MHYVIIQTWKCTEGQSQAAMDPPDPPHPPQIYFRFYYSLYFLVGIGKAAPHFAGLQNLGVKFLKNKMSEKVIK